MTAPDFRTHVVDSIALKRREIGALKRLLAAWDAREAERIARAGSADLRTEFVPSRALSVDDGAARVHSPETRADQIPTLNNKGARTR